MDLGDLTAKLKIDTSDLDRALDRVEARLASSKLRLNTSGIDDPIAGSSRNLSALADEAERTSSRFARTKLSIDTSGINTALDSTERRLTRLGSALSLKPLTLAIIELTRPAIALTTALAPGLDIIAAIPAVAGSAAGAFATLKLGFAGFSDALKAGASGDVQKLNAALAGMPPNARAAVAVLLVLNKQLNVLKQAVQTKLFANIAEPLTTLGKTTFPTLNKGLTGVATAFNETAKATLKAGTTPLFQGKLASILGSTAYQASILGTAVPSLTTGLVSLAAAGEPVVTRFIQFASQGLEAAGAFLSTASGAQKMQDVISKAGDVLSTLFHIAVNLGDAIKNIFVLGGLPNFLVNLQNATKAFDDFTKSAEGKKDISVIFQALSDLTNHLGQTLPLIGRVIVDVLTAIEALPDPLKDALFQTIAWSIALGPLLGALSGLSVGIKGLLDVGKDIGKIAEGFRAIPDSKVVKIAQSGAETAALKVLYLEDVIRGLKDKTVAVDVVAKASSAANTAKNAGASIAGGVLGGIASRLDFAAIADTLGGVAETIASVIFSVPVLIAAAVVAAVAVIVIFRKQIVNFFANTLPPAIATGLSSLGEFLVTEMPKAFEAGLRGLQDLLYRVIPHAFGVAVGAAAAVVALSIVGVIAAIILGITKGIPLVAHATLDLVEAIATTLASAVIGLFNLSQELGHAIVSGVSSAAQSVGTFVVRLGQDLTSGITSAVGAVGRALAALPGVVTGFFDQTVAAAHTFAINFVHDPIGTLEGLVTGVASILSKLPGVAVAAFEATLGGVTAVMTTLNDFVLSILESILGSAASVLGTIGSLFVSAFGGIADTVGGALARIGASFAEAFSSFADGVRTGWDLVNSITHGQLDQWVGDVGNVLATIVNFFVALPGRLVGGIGNTASLLVQKGRDLISGLVTGVDAGVGGVLAVFSDLKNTVVGLIKSPETWLVNAGKSVIDGLIDGIKQGLGPLGDTLGKVGDFIKAHKGPPSYDQVMLVPAGQAIMAGLIAGIQSQRDTLRRTLANITSDVGGLALSGLGVGSSPLAAAGLTPGGSTTSTYQEFNLNIAPVPFSAAQIAQEGVAALQNMARTQKYRSA